MTEHAMLEETRGPRPLRTSAEHDALGAATVYTKMQATGSHPTEGFIDELPVARQNICHRLVRGLLRGRPKRLPPHVVLLLQDPTLPPDAHSYLRSIGAEELIHRMQPLAETTQYVAFLPFPASDAILAAPIATIHGYERFHLVEEVSILTPTETIRGPHPVDLIPLLKREGAFSDDAQADRITAEIAESVANLALARLARRTTRRTLSDASPEQISVLDIREELPGADPASALERLVIEGHPFHPSAKIRRGMTATASLLYAPECTESIDVRFIAVENAYTLQAQTDATLTDLLYDRFTGLDAAVERALPTDRAREGYAVIPIHPWQYYHVIPERYEEQISRDRVVPLSEFTWPATPLLNLRTVVPYPSDETGAKPLPHLKLAVDVQLTNVVRTVSPQAVANGPHVTDVLETILEREAFGTLGILAEPAATCYHDPGGPHPEGEEFDNARNLSGLARVDPYSHSLVSADATPVAVASLPAPSPMTDCPIICDVLDRFATSRDATKSVTASKSFFKAYVDTVVPEQLHLLSKYGVALETHPQNTYAVFEDGRPVATLARDLGGIRLLDERLSYHDLDFSPYPDSDIDADAPRDLYDKLYYALFQNHFTEVIVALTEHTALAESFCWDYLRTCCRETFESLRSNADIPDEWIDQDETALFEDPTVHKALTAMRLRGKRHEYVTSQISNPLASPAEENGST